MNSASVITRVQEKRNFHVIRSRTIFLLKGKTFSSAKILFQSFQDGNFATLEKFTHDICTLNTLFKLRNLIDACRRSYSFNKLKLEQVEKLEESFRQPVINGSVFFRIFLSQKIYRKRYIIPTNNVAIFC